MLDWLQRNEEWVLKKNLNIGGFLHGDSGKESPPASEGEAGDLGLIPGSGRSPGAGNGNLQFLPGESHGQRNLLVGYSPWGCRESDDWARVHTHTRKHWIVSVAPWCIWKDSVSLINCAIPFYAEHHQVIVHFLPLWKFLILNSVFDVSFL